MKREITENHRSAIATPVGNMLQAGREAAGLSPTQAAMKIGTSRQRINRVEEGGCMQPSPQFLAAAARVYPTVRLADLYAVVGYTLPDDLPGFTAYLQAKHPDWQECEIQELADFYTFVAQRHIDRALRFDTDEIGD